MIIVPVVVSQTPSRCVDDIVLGIREKLDEKRKTKGEIDGGIKRVDRLLCAGDESGCL